ncbi:MAG: RtcB family protein [Chloroflexota bacterium]
MSSATSAPRTETLPAVIDGGRVPILTWAHPLEASALAQAHNLSRLPFAIAHVALMPDAHTGYGMPIGGVLFADKAVVPYAIGVDIGCGVALVETDLTVDMIDARALGGALAEIARRVPTGLAGQSKPVDRDAALEEVGRPVPESIQPGWLSHALQQLGSLGSGNHFLELQRDDAGRVVVMLHSGSRGLGKAVCDAFHALALKECKRWSIDLPHNELAYLPMGTDGFHGYWEAMTFALRYAEVNRSRMLDQVEIALGMHTRIGRFERVVDVHHNFAAWEHHLGRDGIVHRKGAVRARAGETVLIPGSMGTASYVAEGLGDPRAFETCQHGAGRAMSRTAARKAWTSKQLFDQMAELGVALHSGDPKTAAEEAPGAYKDTESVRAAPASLVRPVRRLTPLGVMKG